MFLRKGINGAAQRGFPVGGRRGLRILKKYIYIFFFLFIRGWLMDEGLEKFMKAPRGRAEKALRGDNNVGFCMSRRS